MNLSLEERRLPSPAHRGRTHMKLGMLALALAGTLAAGSGSAMDVADTEGFSAERLGRIGPVMKAEIDKGTVPGAVTLIARNGKIVHFEAHGFLDSAKSKPMGRDAVFRGFSMTKPLVAVAALALIEQGKLNLRDPLSQYFPEFKDMKVYTELQDDRGRTSRVAVAAKRPILVWDLFRHTAGLHLRRLRALPGNEGRIREV